MSVKIVSYESYPDIYAVSESVRILQQLSRRIRRSRFAVAARVCRACSESQAAFARGGSCRVAGKMMRVLAQGNMSSRITDSCLKPLSLSELDAYIKS